MAKSSRVPDPGKLAAGPIAADVLVQFNCTRTVQHRPSLIPATTEKRNKTSSGHDKAPESSLATSPTYISSGRNYDDSALNSNTSANAEQIECTVTVIQNRGGDDQRPNTRWRLAPLTHSSFSYRKTKFTGTDFGPPMNVEADRCGSPASSRVLRRGINSSNRMRISRLARCWPRQA